MSREPTLSSLNVGCQKMAFGKMKAYEFAGVAMGRMWDTKVWGGW